jgi:N-acetylglucosaminyl-diphospho-decaprenol L-rhamnosyltransferase
VDDAIDVVIVSFNTRTELVACLQSLFEPAPRRLARVFVVDNASTDGSAAAVRAAWPAVTVIEMGRNAGFAAANNAGIRQATAPLVLLLNSDTVVPPGAIDTLADRLIATGATAAGPRLIDASGRPEISFGSMLTPWTEFVQARRQRRARRGTPADLRWASMLTRVERVVDWVTGACLLVRRDAALAAGLLDERFFMYEEDVDFCAALRARGGRVLFTPTAEVIHLGGRSWPSPGAGREHYDRSHLAFYRKHAPGWAPWLQAWQRLRGRHVR